MKIIYDVFPAHFCAAPPSFEGEIAAHPPKQGSSYVATTRVIVFEALNEENQPEMQLIVAADSPDGAQLVFKDKIQDFDLNDVQYFGITQTGKHFAFKKDTNCGCGSRLRSWNPYKTINSIKDPSN